MSHAIDDSETRSLGLYLSKGLFVGYPLCVQVTSASESAVKSDSLLLPNSPSDVVNWYMSLQAKLTETTSTLESFVKDTKVASLLFFTCLFG